MSQTPSLSPHQSHHETLAASSRRFVDRAFACHEQSDWEGFVVFASTSIELLAKAVLAQVNVLLITGGNNEESLLGLARRDPRRGIPVSVRTIGAEAAIRRAKKLGVPFDRYEKDLATLRKARNVLMHIGSYDSTAVSEDPFDAWVRSMAALAEHAGYERSFVFGANADLVALQMNEYADQLEALLARRMAAAQRCWKEEAMVHEEYALRRDTLEADFARANSWDPSVQWLPCPVCELPAILFGELEDEPDWDYSDGESYIAGIYYEFVPTGVHCETCELDLDSRGLVERSEVLEQWDLSDDDRLRWEKQLWEPDY